MAVLEYFNLETLMLGFSAALIFEFIIQIRKYLDFQYTPIYFSFLPFRVLNRDLAIYIGDDFWMGKSEDHSLTKAEARTLEFRIRARGILAAVVSAVAIPAVAAFCVAQYMTPKAIWSSMVIIAGIQVFRVYLASRDFYLHAEQSDKQVRTWLRVVYAFYLGTMLWMYHHSYFWVRAYVEKKDYAELASTLTGKLFGDIIVSGLLLAAVATLFLNYLTDHNKPRISDDDGET